MEFIIENVTDKEIEILEREDFNWYPDTLDSRDVVIDGNKEYVDKVLKALGRKWKGYFKEVAKWMEKIY